MYNLNFNIFKNSLRLSNDQSANNSLEALMNYISSNSTMNGVWFNRKISLNITDIVLNINKDDQYYCDLPLNCDGSDFSDNFSIISMTKNIKKCVIMGDTEQTKKQIDISEFGEFLHICSPFVKLSFRIIFLKKPENNDIIIERRDYILNNDCRKYLAECFVVSNNKEYYEGFVSFK